MVTLPSQMRRSSSPSPPATRCKEKRMSAFLQKLAKAYKRSAGSIIPSSHQIFMSDQEADEEEVEAEEEDKLKEDQSRLHLNHVINPSENSNPFIIRAEHKKPYSLSYSGAHSNQSHSIAVSSKASTRSTQCEAIADRVVSSTLIAKFTSLWEENAEESEPDQLPPIHPSDYVKTLLFQLSASISTMKSAYARRQAALNPYNMQACTGGAGAGANASTADKVIVEEMLRLSRLHLQLADMLQPMYHPHDQSRNSTLTFSECAGEVDDLHDVKKDSTMLKRYEDIITLFHDEIRRKDAVALALKDTLAKSLLKGEKLESRVKALEAKLSALSMRAPQ